MQSGAKVDMNVWVGDEYEKENRKEMKFSNLSTTGTIVNAKNAVILAAKAAKIKLAN